MKAIKTFQNATNGYLEKVSKLITDSSEDMTVDTAKDLGDLIYKVAQAIKTMSEKDVKKKGDEDEGLIGKSLADRMSKNGS